MKTVAQLLAYGQEHLAAMENPRLETQILLAHTLGCERATLYAWPEKLIEEKSIEVFLALIARRKAHEPIAYLLGCKEFWSQEFLVTPHTLIPRPETELLIEKVLENLPAGPLNLVDAGTGSGIIACTLASLRPQWHITAIDICPQALSIAQKNACKLNVSNISFLEGDWLQAVGEQRFTAIVSNPPYLNAEDPHLKALAYEPQTALVSGPTGLEAFETMIDQAPDHLISEGYLIFEHGFDQASKIRNLLAQANFTEIHTYRDLAGCERVTVGKWQ